MSKVLKNRRKCFIAIVLILLGWYHFFLPGYSDVIFRLYYIDQMRLYTKSYKNVNHKNITFWEFNFWPWKRIQGACWPLRLWWCFSSANSDPIVELRTLFPSVWTGKTCGSLFPAVQYSSFQSFQSTRFPFSIFSAFRSFTCKHSSAQAFDLLFILREGHLFIVPQPDC